MIDIKAYQPGSVVCIKGIPGETHETWAIVSIEIYLVESGNPLKSHDMAQLLTIVAIDENGDDLGKETIKVNVDMYDIKEI